MSRSLVRPVLVVGGWRSPRLMATRAASGLAAELGVPAEAFHVVAFPWAGRIEGGVRRVMSAARGAAGLSPDGSATGPVDVVAISMGGLVSRAAADLDWPGLPRLGLVRLFTLATPHRGAALARWVRPDAAARSMRPGSEFLRRLDEALPRARYELRCYAQRLDWWVGTERCSPPGRDATVVSPEGVMGRLFSHFTIASNAEALRDIAARLVSGA